MKKAIRIIITIVLIISVIASILFFAAPKYEAAHVKYNNGISDSWYILYKKTKYYQWSDIDENYCDSGIIKYSPMSEMYPYSIVNENLRDKIYISNYLSDFSIYDYLPPYDYFSFCGESDDFIYESPDDSSLNFLCIKEGFVFPTIYKNKVDEVWMYLNPTGPKITDEKEVKAIVECAKSDTEKELDKDIYNYIIENSWDNCHFFVKYSGYPLCEEFSVTQTEDGRYVVENAFSKE